MTLEENGDTVPISKLVDGFHSRGALPHLKRENGTYFVTFRLAGTLPREVLLQLKAEREAMIKNALAAKRPLTWREQKELFAWYAERVDKYLDSGHGSCWLARRGSRFSSGEHTQFLCWRTVPSSCVGDYA